MNVLEVFSHFLFVAAVRPFIHWVCGIGNDLFHLTALNLTLNPLKSLDVLFLP